MKLLLGVLLCFSFGLARGSTVVYYEENPEIRKKNDARLTELDRKLIYSGNILRSLLINDKEKLKSVFPEFEVQDLIDLITTTPMEFVNEVLIDKNGKIRTCLNYPILSKIKCSIPEVTQIQDEVSAIFILMLHEYLGLMGIEETSQENLHYSQGYSISSRIVPYISRMNAYDLIIDKSALHGYENTMHQFVEINSIYVDVKVSKAKKKFPTVIELENKSSRNVHQRCAANDKKTVFINSKAQDITHEEQKNNGNLRLVTKGVVVVRYVCE